jgi:hypothetical protein
MNQSILMPIEELLDLKENERLTLLEVSFKQTGTKESPKLTLQVEVDSDYMMVIAPFVDDILETLKASLEIVDMEKLLKQTEMVIPYANIQLFADENGVNIGSRFYQIEEEELMEKGKELYLHLNYFMDKMLESINQLVDEYAEMKDNEEIYSPREFQFLYRKVNKEWEYDSFVRMTDRMISEQKREIHGLISRGIDKKLLAIANANVHNQMRRLAIKFYSDGLSVNGFQVAEY